MGRCRALGLLSRTSRFNHSSLALRSVQFHEFLEVSAADHLYCHKLFTPSEHSSICVMTIITATLEIQCYWGQQDIIIVLVLRSSFCRSTNNFACLHFRLSEMFCFIHPTNLAAIFLSEIILTLFVSLPRNPYCVGATSVVFIDRLMTTTSFFPVFITISRPPSSKSTFLYCAKHATH